MANEREFTLIGKFDDQITKKLQALNEAVSKLNKPLSKDNFTKSIVDGLTASNKEIKELQKNLDQVGKFKMDFDRSGIKAAQEDAKVLMKQLEGIEKQGANFDRSGLKAAQEDALTLGKILEANALIQVGEGFANALATGAQSAVGILQRGMGFVAGQFQKGVADQLEDIQARGSLFGSLQKQGLFAQALEGKEGQALRDANTDMYLQTKNISRSMEGAINEVIRTSTVSSEVIQILSRQLSDNLLPTMLKEKGITDLSILSREKLNEVMGGEQGVATQLATLYSQVASVIPNAQYAPQAAMGLTQFLGQGTIDRQLAIFQQNPVLVDALKEGLAKFGNDVKGRIEAATYAFSIAMPEAALEEAKNTIAGGFQSVQDTLMGPSGILTMTADVAGQGERTLEIMRESGAYAMELARFDERNAKILMRFKQDKSHSDQEVAAFEKKLAEGRVRFVKGLEDFYKSADSPIEVLATQFGPLLQSFANMINNAGNLFIGPINSLVEAIAPGIAKLKQNFDNLGSNLAAYMTGGEGIKMSLGEVLGRAFAEILKALALFFNPDKAGKEIGNGLNKFFEDFMKGFKSKEVDGEYYLNLVLQTIESIIMKLIFKDGNVFEGMTPLGDALAKIFLALAAPAFIMSLISGLTPLALAGFGKLITGVFAGLVAPAAAGTAGAGAAGAGAAAGGAGGFAALLSNPITIILAVIAAIIIFQGPLLAFGNMLKSFGDNLAKSKDMFTSGIGTIISAVGSLINGIVNILGGLWDVLSGMFTGDTEKVKQGFARVGKGIGELIEGIIKAVVGAVIGLIGWQEKIAKAIKTLMQSIWEVITNQKPEKQGPPVPDRIERPGMVRTRGGYESIIRPTREEAFRRGGTSGTPRSLRGYSAESESSAFGSAFGSANPFYGTLSEAINFEMANKPPGSHLVIANSSETIIPAAGGLAGDGLQGLIAAIWGAAQMSTGNITKAVERGAGATSSLLSRGFSSMQQMNARSMELSSRENSQILQAIRAAAAAGGFGGGDMGGTRGSLSGAYNLARQLGLTMTSYRGGRHAEGSYHYSGRAMDFGGDPGAMNQLAAALSRTRPTELIHAPGFSMKNGVRVPPSYWGAGTWNNHYDHVHVAYAMGPGNPALFSSQLAAEAWERKMIPASMRVKTITANSGESFGSSTIHAPITIYQQPNQDAEELASIVAIRIGMAVDEIRNRM